MLAVSAHLGTAGIRITTIGPPGFLTSEEATLSRALGNRGLRLVKWVGRTEHIAAGKELDNSTWVEITYTNGRWEEQSLPLWPYLPPTTQSHKGALSLARASSVPTAVADDAAGAATNISRDGSTAVGYIDSGNGTPYHAYRWTASAGAVDLGTLVPANNATLSSFARDVSSDGSVVVGFSALNGASLEHAFRWTQAGGMADLDPTSTDVSSRAYGVSADGSVVVGQRAGRAFRWTQSGGMQDLGVLAGDSRSLATGVSDDGSIVVGISSKFPIDFAGTGGDVRYSRPDSRAFHWTAVNGMQDLTQLLTTSGASLGGRPLCAATGISPDGSWIAVNSIVANPEFPQNFPDIHLQDPGVATLDDTIPPSRLLNLSTRGDAQTGDGVLIPGFVISGTANKKLLIRAVGPTLGHQPFNVANPLPNPRMTLKRLDQSVTPAVWADLASNDDWATNTNAAAIPQTAAALFAFAFEDDREAALLMDLAPGQYTVVAEGVNNATGVAIVELYDADASTGSGPPASKLINISTRGFVGVGDSIMIPGYVISDESGRTLLVRAVGPKLASFNVSGVLADPMLEIHTTINGVDTIVATNDDWGTNATAPGVAVTAMQVGAFALDSGSKDAALVVSLGPGSYTVLTRGVNNTTGNALVEVYEVP